MKKSPLAMLAGLVLLAAPPLAGQGADPATAEFFSFLSDPARQTLGEKGEVTAVGPSVAALTLGNGSPYEASMMAALAVKSPTVASLGFFVFPKPAGNASLALYNAVSAVASMEGLQYYSVTDKRRETLILASWRVASPGTAAKVPDPAFTEVPPLQKAVVYQKDNRFGEGYSQLTWKALPGGRFELTVENLTPMSFGFFRVVDPGNLKMVFVVVPLADKVAVCAGLQGHTAGLLGLEKSLNDSIRNRMKALADWLGLRIAAVR